MDKLGWIGLILLMVWGCQSTTSSTEQKKEQDEELTQPSIAAPTEQDDRKLIVFFGNSLTAGYGLSPQVAFPALIQHKINEAELGYKVVNAGQSGDTSADGLTRISFLLDQYPPIDVFVLELGANDGLRGLGLVQTSENLQGIIDRVKTSNPAVNIVVAGMMVPPNMGPDYAAQFQKIFPDLAMNNQTALIPFLLDGVAGDPDLNIEDGIHPTEEGHQIVAENVWTVLKELL